MSIVFTGKIKKYIPFDEKLKKGGYGFIEGPDRKEYFFNIHHSELKEMEHLIGLEVEFCTREGFDKTKNKTTIQATGVKAAK
ncbi:MAG: hypothetical protein OEY34_01565 [Cyclobacteriaceae bacterium]|nr:hypothetical protein [Cyclobacteriaceae bacterium]